MGLNYSEVAIQSNVGFTVAETKEGYMDVTFMGNGDLARFLGGSDYAIIINKLQMLTNNQHIKGYNQDGKKWLRIGLFEGEEEITWAAMLNWLNPATTKKYLIRLKDEGFIDFQRMKGKGRSLYYWLNVEALDKLSEPVSRVKKLHETNSANSGLKNGSDLTNREVTSDLTSREITYSEPLNQVSPVVKLPITNRESSKSTNNAENNQESHTEQVIFSPLAIVMAKALELDLNTKKHLTAITKTLTGLTSMYGKDVNEDNIIKVSSLVKDKYGSSPAKVYSQWSKLLAQTPEQTEVECKAKELQEKASIVANRIKEICKPPCIMGWEHISVKSKKTLLSEVSCAIVTNSQESLLNSFTWWGGNEKPTIDQFNRAWVDHVSKTNHKGETKNEHSTASDERFVVGTLSQSVFDRLAAK